MEEVELVRRIGAPAAKVWDMLSWRGMATLANAGFFQAVEFDGEAVVPGVTKRVQITDSLAVRERLDWLDAPGFGYGYRIIDGGGLSVTNYTGEVRITPCGSDACMVYMQCRFARPSDEGAEWPAQWKDGETRILNAVEARLTERPEPTAVSEDIIAIVRARSDVFEQDFASGDATRLVANYYVAEPKIIAPQTPMLAGREAATALFANLLEIFATCTLRQVEVRQSGDMAYELGDAVLQPRDPATPVMEARYVIIWNRVDGEWRVATDFFADGLLGLDPG